MVCVSSIFSLPFLECVLLESIATALCSLTPVTYQLANLLISHQAFSFIYKPVVIISTSHVYCEDEERSCQYCP